LVTLIIARGLGEPRTGEEWEASVTRARQGLFEVAVQVCGQLSKILDDRGGRYTESVADAREYYDRLLVPGWLLCGRLAEWALGFQGLEVRLTRMFGSPPAKDLAKLERYRDAAAEIWKEDVGCGCGECPGSMVLGDRILKDSAIRLREFSPELRHK